MSKTLGFGLALLVVTGAYLAAARPSGLVYLATVLAHPLLGLLLFAPFFSWCRRWGKKFVVSGLLLLGSVGASAVLIALGNSSQLRPVLWAHVVLAVAGLVALLWAFADQRTGWWRLAVLGLLAAIVMPVAVRWRHQDLAGQVEPFRNPIAAVTMAEEAMGGADGPFYPSAVSTSTGELLPSRMFTNWQSCGRAGCHTEIVEQWSSSAHRFSGLDNPWYRTVHEQFREEKGPVAARWCAGCHVPAALLSGEIDKPVAEVAETAAGSAGVSCFVCHGISEIQSTMGQGDYEIEVPFLHDLATRPGVLSRWIHDLLLRLDPEPHRLAYGKPFMSGDLSGDYCSACHKAYADEPVNDYRVMGVMNDFDPWQDFSISGRSMTNSVYFPEPQTCVDCHMPKESALAVEAGVEGPSSHRFAAAHTGAAILADDERQMRAVTDFLSSGQVSVDVFAMAPGRPLDQPSTDSINEVHAPLDRLSVPLRRGEANQVHVVVRSRNVGHLFPGGKMIPKDCWVEFQAIDDQGKIIFWSGRADEGSALDANAHTFGPHWIDKDGNSVGDYEIWKHQAGAFSHLIDPSGSNIVRFRVEVPENIGESVTLTARLKYRRFRPEFTHKAFSKQGLTPPIVPIVVMAEDSVTLPVIGADEPFPEVASPRETIEEDYERWNDYAYGFILTTDYRFSRMMFRKLLELKPDYADGWTTLGNLDWALGDVEVARESLQRALELDPTSVRAQFYMAMIYRNQQNHEEAIKRLYKVAESFPGEARIWREVGRMRMLDGDHQGAVDAFTQLLATNPFEQRAHFMLNQAYRALGNVELADRYLSLYKRYQEDSLSSGVARAYLETHAHAQNERVSLHEHVSLSLENISEDD